MTNFIANIANGYTLIDLLIMVILALIAIYAKRENKYLLVRIANKEKTIEFKQMQIGRLEREAETNKKVYSVGIESMKKQVSESSKKLVEADNKLANAKAELDKFIVRKRDPQTGRYVSTLSV